MSAAVRNALPRATPKVRFKNILLATDFGSASIPAQTYAILLARMFSAHLFVLHVDEISQTAEQSAGPPPLRGNPPGDLDFRGLEKFFAGVGIPFTFLVEQGAVGATVDRAADEHAIDLIILGTHARHGLPYLRSGSIAESFGRSSPRPVITVGPRATACSESPIKSILYATDFSEESKLALPYATSLAQEFHAELTIFHVAPLAERLVLNHAQIEACLIQQLKRLAPPSRWPWCSLTHEVRYGETAAEILLQARAQDADLIVLGLHNSIRFTSHFPERLAYRILCGAPCPVLSVVPSAGESKTAHLQGKLPGKLSPIH
jgi:nucleotide-binding universal stress UspA family protein